MPRQGPRSNQRLGNKYLLSELLGEGGFGAVYRAHNEHLDRIEAIKIVEPHGSDDPKWQQRFMREAKVLAKLEHPNIIPVYDCGFDEDKEVLYLTMPFVDGGTLEDILRVQQKPFSLKVTEHFLQQISSALDYAHAQGVVHLDLKPANLLLRRRSASTLLLSDFGLAHIAEEEKIEGGTSLQFGTPHYMAPEQIKGQPQASSDIYALGVIVYRMLTGHLPYSSSGPSIYVDHLQAPIPRISTIRPELPVALDEIISNALAKDPIERFKSAGILLKNFQKSITPSAPSPLLAPTIKAIDQKSSRMEELKKLAASPARELVRNANEPIVAPKVQQPEVALKQDQKEIEVQAEKATPSPQKKTLAERRQAFIKKFYPSMDPTRGIWLLPFFFLIGPGFILDTYVQYQSALIIMAIAALIGYIMAYRKTTPFFTFVLVLLFSGTLIFLLSEKVLFPVSQQSDSWIGRQTNAGLIISGIPAFLMYFLNIPTTYKQKNSIYPRVMWAIAGSTICNIPIWLIVSLLAAIFKWGFGFGDSWYLSLLYQFIGIITAIGLMDFTYVLFKHFD